MRDRIRVDFEGGTYRELFYVADVETTRPVANGELHVDLDESDFLAVFPLNGQGRVRLIGTVRDERADRADQLTFDDVSGHALKTMDVQIREVHWFSTSRWGSLAVDSAISRWPIASPPPKHWTAFSGIAA